MAGSPSSPSTQVYIARDDQNGAGLGIGGGQWNFDEKPYYFGGRFLWPGFSVNASSPRASWSYSFDGTELRVIGYTQPAQGNSPQFQVTIDTNNPYNTTTDDNAPEHWKQWYQTPVLADAHHTVKFDQVNGQGIDFLVVTPGPNTALNAQMLIVDDTYVGIRYSGAGGVGNGGWQTNKNAVFTQSSIWGGSYFMNTSHTTTTTGDKLRFSYTGSNASIYGAMLWEQPGSYSISYSIDNGTNFSKTFTSETTNAIKQQPNFQLIDTGPLSPGNHTIEMTLSACISQTLLVDYIVYQPAFDTLAAMPNLTQINNPSSSGTSTTSKAGDTGTPTGTPDNGGDGGGGGGSSNAGAIAGGVVGGLVFIALVAALVWFLLRRKRQNERFSYDSTQPPAGPVPTNNFGRVVPPQNLNSGAPSVTHSSYIVEPFPADAGPSVTGPLVPLRGSDGGSPPPPGMRTKPGMISAYPPSSSYYSSEIPHEGSVAGSSSSGPSQAVFSPASLSGSGSGGGHPESVDELRRRVQQLTSENHTLRSVAAAPPAYG